MTLPSAPSDRGTPHVWKRSRACSNLSVFDNIHSDETILKSERSQTKAGFHLHVSKPGSDFETEVTRIPI